MSWYTRRPVAGLRSQRGGVLWNSLKPPIGAYRRRFCRSSMSAWSIKQFRAIPCAPIDADLVELAIGNSVRYRISYWDGAVVAAAGMLGATRLFTEDLNHGQKIGSVRVTNP